MIDCKWSEDEPDACRYCTGEACRRCFDSCDHDVIERHG